MWKIFRPVESVEVFRKEPSTQLVVTVDGEFQHDYTLKGKYLEVVISKLKADEKPKPKSVLEKEGKLISINFQDIPVRNVLQLIADYNGFNLVVSDSVVVTWLYAWMACLAASVGHYSASQRAR